MKWLLEALQARWPGDWQVQELGVSGFCSTWRARGAAGDCFVKTLPAPHAATLLAEADGLRALAATGCLRVPQVLDCRRDDASGLAWLAMEWLALQPPQAGFGERLGRALGALHRHVPQDGQGRPALRFGWAIENRLGPTPQPNAWSREGGLAGWIEFLREQRLGALNQRLRTGGQHAALADAVQRVADALPRFFDDGHVPRPSLIHGDLWHGNCGALAGDEPVVYDPAVSLSDAEMELALLELFGPPPAGFWPAYREVAGLSAGYARRRPLYQLYHLLNHVLIFGGGYGRQAMAAAQELLAAG